MDLAAMLGREIVEGEDLALGVEQELRDGGEALLQRLDDLEELVYWPFSASG